MRPNSWPQEQREGGFGGRRQGSVNQRRAILRRGGHPANPEPPQAVTEGSIAAPATKLDVDFGDLFGVVADEREALFGFFAHQVVDQLRGLIAAFLIIG